MLGTRDEKADMWTKASLWANLLTTNIGILVFHFLSFFSAILSLSILPSYLHGMIITDSI